MFVLVYEWLSLLEQRMFTCLWDVLKQRFSWPLPPILYKENNNINKNKNTKKRKEKKIKFPVQKLMNLHITFIIKAIWYNILNLILNTMIYKYIVWSLQYECKYIFSWFYQQTKLSHQANFYQTSHWQGNFSSHQLEPGLSHHALLQLLCLTLKSVCDYCRWDKLRQKSPSSSCCNETELQLVIKTINPLGKLFADIRDRVRDFQGLSDCPVLNPLHCLLFW